MESHHPALVRDPPASALSRSAVPRAGPSDIIVALTRLLDPACIRVQPTSADVRQQRPGAATGYGAGASTMDTCGPTIALLQIWLWIVANCNVAVSFVVQPGGV